MFYIFNIVRMIMKFIYKLIFLLNALCVLSSVRRTPFFRKDYTYVEQFDSFYKAHWDIFGLTWSLAFLACEDEGATLFYPKYRKEWTVVKNLTIELQPTYPSSFTDIFIGLRDRAYAEAEGPRKIKKSIMHRLAGPFPIGCVFSESFSPNSIFSDFDRPSTPLFMLTWKKKNASEFSGGHCILMNVDTGFYRCGPCYSSPPLPFVCTKRCGGPCPTVDPDYQYVRASKKCYKINKKRQMWDGALRTCDLEGGILTVVETEKEANGLRTILTAGTTYYVGTRRNLSRDDEYFTVKGLKVNQVYQRRYSRFSYRRDCGTVYASNTTLYTTTSDCDSKLPFICEMAALE